VFKRGVEVDRLIGFPGEAKVAEWISKNI